MGVRMETNNIINNQVGYLPEQRKIAFFKRGDIGKAFSVINVENGKVAYIGKILSLEYSEIADEEVAIGDFSKIKEVGEYKIINSRRESSYSFTIGTDIYHNVLKDSVRFFYLQRCGEMIEEEYGSKWAHPACHIGLATVYGSTHKIDVTGGWHDAGDYGRYILATAKAVADLFLAYEANPEAFQIDFNVPRREKKMSYLLEEIKGQLVWMLKMQDPISGGVHHKVTCAHFPGYAVMPQDEVKELIVCPISTMATGVFAAVMAMAYEHYNKIDSVFANKCLKAAEMAWGYLENTPEGGFKNPIDITTGEYGGDSDLDERYWAAAQLFKATGKEKYAKTATEYATMEALSPTDLEHLEDGDTLHQSKKKRLEFSYGWKGTGAYGDKAYLYSKDGDEAVKEIIRRRVIARADQIIFAATQDGYRIYPVSQIYVWGSNMYMLMLALFLKDAYEIDAKEVYLEQAHRYIDYCFGANPLSLSYVTGYGKRYAQHPHHRPSIARGEAIPGMLVGGPNEWLADPVAQKRLQDVPAAKCYIDDYESFGTNEVDIYWNSMLVCALVRLNMV